MISQESYKRQKRRLATAQNRFTRARQAVPSNSYSNDLEGTGIQRLGASVDAARVLLRVAREGLEIFDSEGYPDSWHTWARAEDDARAYLGRSVMRLDRAAIFTDPIS
jgi:hypothetical protein